MAGLYKKIGNTFLLKVLGLNLAFILQMILSRILKPEAYGQYTMLLTYVNVISLITVIGMDRNLIREVAKVVGDKSKSIGLLNFALKISCIFLIVISMFIAIFRDILPVPERILYLFLIMLLIKVIITILDGFLQGIGLVVKVTLLNVVINNFLKIILFIILVNFQLDKLYSAAYSFIITEIVMILIRSISIKKFIKKRFHIQTVKEEFSHEEKIKFIKYSLTVGLIAGISLLLQNIDKIMIANFMGFNSVGIYKVAQNYVGLIGIFISPFIAFWPQISKLYKDNKIIKIECEMKKIVKIVTYLVIPMFFIFFFLKEKMLIIFGKEYVLDEAKKVLIILGFAFLIDAISGPIGSILTMTKYAKYVLINSIISLFLNVVLNFLLIKKYGIVGVAIGTAISVIINNLISIIEVKLLIGIFSYDHRFFVQILSMSALNFIICNFISNTMKIENIYFYVVSFVLTVYIINGMILTFFYKDIFKKIIIKR